MPIIKVPQPIVTPGAKVSPLAFRNRFTHAEKVAMETAAQTSAELRVFLGDLAVSKFVDLTDPQTIGGTQHLESIGLLEVGRAGEILTAPVQPHEVADVD